MFDYIYCLLADCRDWPHRSADCAEVPAGAAVELEVALALETDAEEEALPALLLLLLSLGLQSGAVDLLVAQSGINCVDRNCVTLVRCQTNDGRDSHSPIETLTAPRICDPPGRCCRPSRSPAAAAATLPCCPAPAGGAA